MGKTAAIPMDKEIQNFLFIFTGQQYKKSNSVKGKVGVMSEIFRNFAAVNFINFPRFCP